MLDLYNSKYFDLFKNYFVIFAERLNNFLIKKYGTDSDKHPWDLYKDIIPNYHTIISLMHIEHNVYNFLTKNHDFFPEYFHEKFNYQLGHVYANAVEIYLNTHKVSAPVKRRLGEDYYYYEGSPTWAYTLWKEFKGGDEKSQSLIISYIVSNSSYLLSGKNYELIGLPKSLDITTPILKNEIKFFQWLDKIFLEDTEKYGKGSTSDYYKRIYNAYKDYLYDQIQKLNPKFWEQFHYRI
jgi:hypothetical protein